MQTIFLRIPASCSATRRGDRERGIISIFSVLLPSRSLRNLWIAPAWTPQDVGVGPHCKSLGMTFRARRGISYGPSSLKATPFMLTASPVPALSCSRQSCCSGPNNKLGVNRVTAYLATRYQSLSFSTDLLNIYRHLGCLFSFSFTV